MAKITPNEPCPCGLDAKFKKCCYPFLQGQDCDSAERLIRVRHAALVNHMPEFLWQTLHPQSPRKLNDTWHKFEGDFRLIRNLEYKSFRLLDGDVSKPDAARFVQYVTVFEGEHELSYLEESKLAIFEEHWRYFDGLRRSSLRLGCLPESVKLGELHTFFLHDSGKH